MSTSALWYKEVPVQGEVLGGGRHGHARVYDIPASAARSLSGGQQAEYGWSNHGGVFTFPLDTTRSLIWRTTEDARRLDFEQLLGPNSTNNLALKKKGIAVPAISFRFSAPIQSGVHVSSIGDKYHIYVMLMTADGRLHQLAINTFDASARDTEPQSVTLPPHPKWAGLEASLFKVLAPGSLLLGCTNGQLLVAKYPILGQARSFRERDYDITTLKDAPPVVAVVEQPPTGLQSLFSRIQSTVLGSQSVGTASGGGSESMHALSVAKMKVGNEFYLMVLCQDRKIRVWSTSGSECLHTIRIPQEHGAEGDLGMEKDEDDDKIDLSSKTHLALLADTDMPWCFRLLCYIPTENGAQLSLFTFEVSAHGHLSVSAGHGTKLSALQIHGTSGATSSLDLVDMSVVPTESGYTIWGLWHHHIGVFVRYLEVRDPAVQKAHFREFERRKILEGPWIPVATEPRHGGYLKSLGLALEADDMELEEDRMLDFIFRYGQYSNASIGGALASFTRNPDQETLFYAKRNSLSRQEVRSFVKKTLADTIPKIKHNNSDSNNGNNSQTAEQEKSEYRQLHRSTWTRFISACAQREHLASVPLALSIQNETGCLTIVKQQALSMLAVCQEAEVVYHTYLDKQFSMDVFESPASGASAGELNTLYPAIRLDKTRKHIGMLFEEINKALGKLTDEARRSLESMIAGSLAGAVQKNGEKASASEARRTRRLFDDIYSHLGACITRADQDKILSRVILNSEYLDTIRTILNLLIVGSSDSANHDHHHHQHHRHITTQRVLAELVGSSVQQVASHRYELASSMLVLIAMILRNDLLSDDLMSKDASLVVDAVTIAHALQVLRWISYQVIGLANYNTSNSHNTKSILSSSGADGITSHLANLDVQQHGGLHQQSSRKEVPLASGHTVAVEFPVTTSIPVATSNLISQVGALDHVSLSGTLSSSDQTSAGLYYARFAQKLVLAKEFGLLMQFLDLVPESRTLAYYRGRSYLALGQEKEALELFKVTAECFEHSTDLEKKELEVILSESQSFTTKKSAEEAGTLLSPQLVDYYLQLVKILRKEKAHKAAIYVIRRVLVLVEGGNGSVSVGDGASNSKLAKSLWEQLFSSTLAIRSYEAAHAVLLHLPKESDRVSLLGTFVNTMMENKNDIQQICQLAFTGLEDEVEKILVKKATKQAVLAKPNLYKVLYSYHISHQDYRNAALAMYQYARRLLSLFHRTDIVYELVSEAVKSYLAAISALALLGPNQAWITVPAGVFVPLSADLGLQQKDEEEEEDDQMDVDQDDDEDDEDSPSPKQEHLKRRKMNENGDHVGATIQKLDVIQLEDLRRDYNLAKAKLEQLQLLRLDHHHLEEVGEREGVVHGHVNA